MSESEGFCQSSSRCDSEMGMAGREPADGVGLQADRLRALVESPVTTWFLADRERFLDFNHGFELLTGYGHTELAALAPSRLFPHQWSHHPSTTDGEPLLHSPLAKGGQGEFPFPTGGWSEVADSLLTLLTTGEAPASREAPSYGFETRIITKVGVERWVTVKAAPFARADGQAFLAHAVDITSYKEREEALRRSEMRYRKVFEFAPDAIFIHDTEGRGLDGNPEAFNLLGGSPQQDKAPDLLTVTETWHEEDKARFPEIQKQTLERGEYRGEMRAYKKDGRIIDIETRVKVADIGGETVVIAITRDISERKRMEEQIRNSLQEKEMLLREIHHRVKNNMQTVAALLRLQGRRVASPEARAALHEAMRRVATIALVHEMLSQTIEEVVDFDEVFGRSMRLAADVASAGAAVRTVREGAFGLVRADDATALALVLTELVTNAVEHGLRSHGGTVTIAAERDGQDLVARVIDDGVGMSAPPAETSTGLGMQIVRTLVRGELNGSIEWKDAVGGGTEVVLHARLREMRGAGG